MPDPSSPQASAPDPVAVLLEQIQERQKLASDASLGFSRMEERHAALIKVAYEDTPLLLAALRAVLKEADQLKQLRTAPPSGELDEAALLGIHWCAARVGEVIRRDVWLRGEEPQEVNAGA